MRTATIQKAKPQREEVTWLSLHSKTGVGLEQSGCAQLPLLQATS